MKNIIEIRYMSTYDFVSTNGLEKEAVELFGKEWEAEDDMEQIKDLLKHVGAEHFEVMYIEGLRSDYDLEVVFNSDLKEIADLKKQNKLLTERLNANHSTIDEATDSFKEMGIDLEDSAAYVELLSQLAPNEELLKSIEDK